MHAASNPDTGLPDLPLVLLPGTLCDERIFTPLLQRLSVRNSSVVLTPNAHSLEEAAQQVLANAPQRFALLGFSLGGMVAMEAALRAPDRVGGLALVSTTPVAVPSERHTSRREAVKVAASMPMHRFVRQHLWRDYGGFEGDAVTLPLLEHMAEALGPGAFASQTEQALGRSDFCPRLALLSCPTLILGGEADPLCPPEAQRLLAEAIPHSTSVLLAHAGHFAVYERPDEIAQAVAAWFHTTSLARQTAEPTPGAHHVTEPNE